jgi:UDP-glucose 4-epimerase
MPKAVAVTGGSGQLGTLVLRRLAADPDVRRIVSIDLAPPLAASQKLLPVAADIRGPDLARHLAGCDALVHCAFVVVRGSSADAFRAINVGGSINVFEAAAAAGVRTIVHMSSVTAYGCLPDNPVPIRETTPLVDQTDFPYASCKFRVEQFLDGFEKAHPDIAISRIRANILVGRHMRHLLGKLLHIRWMPDFGGTPLPFVWDEDVADLVMLALRNRARGPFNAAADELLTAEEFAERTDFVPAVGWWPLVEGYRALKAIAGTVGLHLPDLAWYEKTKGAMLIATSERAKTELGWHPQYPTATAVLERFCAIVPFGLDFRVQIFLRVALLFFAQSLADSCRDADDRPVRINLCLDGRAGRDLTLERVDGTLAIRGGPRPDPTSIIQLPDVVFRKILVGRILPERARSGGDIVVEGNVADWQTFTRFVASLVALQHIGGPRALILRGLARVMTFSRLSEQTNSGAAS